MRIRDGGDGSKEGVAVGAALSQLRHLSAQLILGFPSVVVILALLASIFASRAYRLTVALQTPPVNVSAP
jgi:hypothetical protein